VPLRDAAASAQIGAGKHVRAVRGGGRIGGMNVKEVMSREVRTIRMVDRADAAARVMWEHDCGAVPVVDGNQAVVGIVTDRDLCMAGYTQGRPLGEIAVTAVMARSVRSCKPDDAVAVALATMQQHQLHRLPVVDARGVAVGMLTINDLLRLAHGRPAAVDVTAVLKTLAAITAPRRAPATAVASATPAAKPAGAPVAQPAAAVAPPPVAIPGPAATLMPAPASKSEANKDRGKGGKANGNGKGKKG
jgi:CBS-domain-containing membrane protein